MVWYTLVFLWFFLKLFNENLSSKFFSEASSRAVLVWCDISIVRSTSLFTSRDWNFQLESCAQILPQSNDKLSFNFPGKFWALMKRNSRCEKQVHNSINAVQLNSENQSNWKEIDRNKERKSVKNSVRVAERRSKVKWKAKVSSKKISFQFVLLSLNQLNPTWEETKNGFDVNEALT